MRITANAKRHGEWWVIDVPEIGFMTQAKRLTEVEGMARSLVVDLEGVDPETIEVTVNAELDAPVLADLTVAKTKLALAQELMAEASNASRKVVEELRGDGFTVREVAQLMGISPGRVTQIQNKGLATIVTEEALATDSEHIGRLVTS